MVGNDVVQYHHLLQTLIIYINYMYHFLFVFLIILGYLYFVNKPTNPKVKKNYIIYVCSILAFQSGFRNLAVGADTYGYYMRFEKILSTEWREIWQNFYDVYVLGEGKDAGYDLLEKAFQMILPDYRCFMVTVAIFFFYSWGRLLNRHTENVFQVFAATGLYLLLFYSFFSVTGIRQSISVALSINAFLALENKNWKEFALCLVPAFFIHKSAAIIAVYPLLYHVKKRKLLTVFAFAAFIFCAIYRNFLVAYFREAADYDLYESSLPIALMVLYFVLTMFTIQQIFALNKEDPLNKIYNMFIPTFMWIPLLGWDSLFMREVLFFAVFITILAPFFLQKLRVKNSLLVTAFICFFYIEYLIIASPYKFMWEYMPLGSNY